MNKKLSKTSLSIIRRWIRHRIKRLFQKRAEAERQYRQAHHLLKPTNNQLWQIHTGNKKEEDFAPNIAWDYPDSIYAEIPKDDIPQEVSDILSDKSSLDQLINSVYQENSNDNEIRLQNERIARALPKTATRKKSFSIETLKSRQKKRNKKT